jgi:uncharacterized membrane protein
MLKSLLATLRITRTVAVIIFIGFVALFVVTAQLYWSFAEAGGTLTQRDLVALTILGGFVLIVASLSGWLAFSAHGRALLKESAQLSRAQPRPLRLAKVLAASAGMAIAVWLVLIVLALVIGGPEWVSKMFLPWVPLLLTVLCSPIAYKWLD